MPYGDFSEVDSSKDLIHGNESNLPTLSALLQLRLNQTSYYNIAVLAFSKSQVMTQNQPTGTDLRKPNG